MVQSSAVPRMILFVCIGNACRSQMAEAYANHYGRGRVKAYSAGLYPLGSIVKDTYAAMKAEGISLDGQFSKSLKDVAVAGMDVVVRMGKEVDRPLPSEFNGRMVDWDIPDPFNCGIETFREVRDTIARHVLALLAELIPPDAAA